MALILEQMQIVEGFPAVDLQTGANTGDWVSLANYKHAAVVFVSGVGTAGDDPTLVLQQATDNAAGGAKDFNPSPSKCFKKQAATSLASTGQWSAIGADLSGNDITNATAAEQSLIWVVELDADELDADGGFDHIRATVADVGGNAQPGYLFYLLSEPRYPAAATNMLSAL
jgi:hypothetical protein